MNLCETYNLIAEEWHRDHQRDDWWVAGADAFVSRLPPGALVLDAGCGGGTKAKYLVGKGIRVVGIDFAEKMVAIARREVPSATFEVMPFMEADKLGRPFDGVFMQAALLHVPKKDVAQTLSKLVSTLKPGGFLYVSVKGRDEGQLEEETKSEDDYGYAYERFFSYFTLDEVKDAMREAGCEPVHEAVNPSGRTNWIHVTGRKL